MVSHDMQQEEGRRNWEEETQRRYELEQLAEADRDQRVEVSFHHMCLAVPEACMSGLQAYAPLLQFTIVDSLWKPCRLFTVKKLEK